MKEKNKLTKIFNPRMLFYDFVKVTSAIPVAIGERTKKLFPYHNAKDYLKGRVIICCNHRSLYDPVIILNAFWKRRVCFIASSNIFKNKMISLFFAGFTTIKINRENISVETFKQAKKVINDGHVLAIFPEASIDRNGDIRNFNSGVGLLSVLCDAPILPVYVAPRKKWQRRVVVVGKKIDIAQHFPNKKLTITQIQDITNIIHDEEKKLESFYNSWLLKRHEK